MVRPVQGSCTAGGGLLRQPCLRDAVAACVYCGRRFCDQHGERGPDHSDTCSRRACRRKRRDLLDHTAWRQRGQAVNRGAICATELCEDRMRHRCSRCRLMFCAEHMRNMRVISDSGMRDHGRAVVCDHCRGRRGVWE